MKKIITFICLLATLSLQAALPQETIKRRMISDLDFIKSVFEVKYAPMDWKQEYAGWDLDVEVEKAKNAVLSDPRPSIKRFHILLKELFNSACDYHVGIVFYSTEAAYLPFMVKGTQGRYFVVHVDRQRCSQGISNGDEILTFNSQPIHSVIQDLRRHECGQNTPETDQALAELMLTARRGDRGAEVPKGNVVLGIKKKKNGEISQHQLSWSYSPEKISDLSDTGTSFQCRMLKTQHEHRKNGPEESLLDLKNNPLFKKMMVNPMWEKLVCPQISNPHSLGARKSFVPLLGRKCWKSSENSCFDAYIYQHPGKGKVGYIRIPHYMGDEDEAAEFEEIIRYFQRTTDALVIDQVNNPGGDLFYLYGLASMLTDHDLYTPKHHLMLTQVEVNMAVQLLPILEQIPNSSAARELFGPSISGYVVDFEMIRLFRQFCRFVIDEWNAGQIYTKPIFLLGIDDIRPHPRTRYTKPILLLTNELDFSGGDFFPAILQDSERALILGTRTAGAGGYVQGTQFPNRTGIAGFQLTGSIAERKNLKPLENLGVKPDIVYEISATDLQEDYKDYLAAILAGVDTILKRK